MQENGLWQDMRMQLASKELFEQAKAYSYGYIDRQSEMDVSPSAVALSGLNVFEEALPNESCPPSELLKLLGTHAFSKVLAAGRPDQTDMSKIEEFATKIVEKIGILTAPPPPISVAGNNPPQVYYTPIGIDGNPAIFLKAKPKTDMEKCIHCGVCIRRCPMGSINPNDPSSIIDICIKCHALGQIYSAQNPTFQVCE